MVTRASKSPGPEGHEHPASAVLVVKSVTPSDDSTPIPRRRPGHRCGTEKAMRQTIGCEHDGLSSGRPAISSRSAERIWGSAVRAAATKPPRASPPRYAATVDRTLPTRTRRSEEHTSELQSPYVIS